MKNEKNIKRNNGKEKKKITKQNIIIAVLAILLLASLAFGMAGRHKDSRFQAEFEDEQIRETVKSEEGRGIEIPGYSKIIVNSDKKDVLVDIFNPEENEVYFKVNFILKDSGEKIFESKLIKPGQHLYDITLMRPLKKGTEDMIIEYETFAMDGNYSPRNGASVNCVLEVK